MNTELVDPTLARFSDWAFTSSIVVLVAALVLLAVSGFFMMSGDRYSLGTTSTVELGTTVVTLLVAIIYARAETADFVRNATWYAILPFLLIRLLSGVRR